MELTQTIELITPDRARQLLALNTRNRPLVKANLNKLIDEINKGLYKFNGDSIKVSKSNVILDGQHRLMAIVHTGIAIKTVVITGLDDDVFDTIDQGTARTLGALIGMDKVDNYNICAAIIPLLMIYDESGLPTTNGRRSSKPIMLKYFNENKNEIVASARAARSHSTMSRWLTPAYVGFLHVILSRVDNELCADFFTKIETGVGMDDNSPEFLLREKLIKIISSVKKESMLHRTAYVIIAWNYMREGKRPKLLRWTVNGEYAQDFPIAK
ncbi:MAG: hypothetical protein Q7U38_14205 [Methylobacter sp.]|nr:hypothetical protein [Methylobacter sp.]MDP2169650.1 hypothetical protein [Rhodocyclaceae bacterium]MDP2429037.1 hypothetical protein [Methylobacter sp.]MDP3056538.1 hypothetical protein [Methylobacter sp.]MDP3362027.1 hypothetical protein [Methylobacter sp.]